jgi:hypothetical protein
MSSSPNKQQGPLQAYLDEVRVELERALFIMQAHPNSIESRQTSAQTLLTLHSSPSWESNSSFESASVSSGATTRAHVRHPSGGGGQSSGATTRAHVRHPSAGGCQGPKAPAYPIHPIVEVGPKELIRQVMIRRKNAVPMKKTNDEFCLIESTANSLRCSFRFKQDGTCDVDALTIGTAEGVVGAAPSVARSKALGADLLEQAILSKLLTSFHQSAERYLILRRKPIPGYSISFLIVQDHLHRLGRAPIMSNILDFVGQLDQEINMVKISLNAHLRQVAGDLFKPF